MGKPRVIPDEDHEVVYERVAAAKASGVVFMRTPDPGHPGRFVNRIWGNVGATRAQITGLGRELLKANVQMVTLEPTSDYWPGGPAGVRVAGQEPQGAAEDKLDAMWLARLTQ